MFLQKSIPGAGSKHKYPLISLLQMTLTVFYKIIFKLQKHVCMSKLKTYFKGFQQRNFMLDIKYAIKSDVPQINA